MITYIVKHFGITSDVIRDVDQYRIATFFSTSIAGYAGAQAREDRANQYAKILNGEEYYREPPTPEYISAHTYALRDIPRMAIISRNESIDELRQVLSSIGRTVGVAGWGTDYEHLLARIQELVNDHKG